MACCQKSKLMEVHFCEPFGANPTLKPRKSNAPTLPVTFNLRIGIQTKMNVVCIVVHITLHIHMQYMDSSESIVIFAQSVQHSYPHSNTAGAIWLPKSAACKGHACQKIKLVLLLLVMGWGAFRFILKRWQRRLAIGAAHMYHFANNIPICTSACMRWFPREARGLVHTSSTATTTMA